MKLGEFLISRGWRETEQKGRVHPLWTNGEILCEAFDAQVIEWRAMWQAMKARVRQAKELEK